MLLKKKHNNFRTLDLNIFLCLAFLGMIYIGFIPFCRALIFSENPDYSSVESYFDNIDRKTDYINLYGFMQNTIGKREIENFTIFKNSYNKLVAPRQELNEYDIDSKIQEVSIIWDYLEDKGIPFVYIEPPLPISSASSELPYGVDDYSYDNAEYLHSKLEGIQTINLSKSINQNREEFFYHTDHHWSGDTSFKSYHTVVDELVEMGILAPNQTVDERSFKRIAVEHFLGSYGVRVGKYYDGEDEYVYYEPECKNSFSCETMTADGEMIANHTGSWYEALMDDSILKDSKYNNKYNAALWGNGGENRIVNHDLERGKLLLISHSYGRPLAQYLALEFHEVRQIDPQEGRFDRNYLTYIEEYKPDVVLFLVEFEGEIIGNYRTSDE